MILAANLQAYLMINYQAGDVPECYESKSFNRITHHYSALSVYLSARVTSASDHDSGLIKFERFTKWD